MRDGIDMPAASLPQECDPDGVGDSFFCEQAAVEDPGAKNFPDTEREFSRGQPGRRAAFCAGTESSRSDGFTFDARAW